MSRVLRACWLVTVASSWLGCATTRDEVEEYPPELVAASQVERALAPGATKVSLFGESPGMAEHDTFVDTTRLVEVSDDAGRRLVSVGIAQVLYTDDGRGGAYRIGPGGEVARLEVSELPPAPAGGVAGADTGWVSYCSAAGASLLGVDAAGRAEIHAADDRCCSNALGPSRRPGRLVWYSEGSTEAVVRGYDVRTATAGPERAVALPAAGVRVFFAEESAEGDLELVATGGTTIYRFGEEGVRASAPWSGAPSAARRRPGGSELEIIGGSQLWRWSGLDGEAPTAIPTPAVPAGAEPWIARGTPGALHAARAVSNPDANPDWTSLRVPVEYHARTLSAGAEPTRSIATTPCLSRAECRRHGESYLVGLHDLPTGTLGVYLFWAWSSPLAFFVAPVDRGDEP